MKLLLVIAFGGALGAVARFSLVRFIHLMLGQSFPYGILAVNFLGSFLIGIAAVVILPKMAFAIEWRSFLLIGVLGAFTTFSTFSLETIVLIERGAVFLALLNIILNVSLCLGATFLGMWISVQFTH